MGHLHDRERRTSSLLVGVHKLADTGAFTGHHVVGQDHRERLMADQLLGHQHGVAQAKLLLLAHVADLGHVTDLPDAAEHLDVTTLLQQ